MGAEAPGQRRGVLIAAALAAALLLPIALGHPYWQTVDDAFAAMVIHGYGVAPAPDPGVWYSAVLYARLVEALHTVGGLQAYGVATYALLAAAAASTGWALWRAGAGGPFVCAALLAVFAPASLYPQFTVLAGLLALAGALVMVQGRGWGAAATAAGLILLAGLVRRPEMLAVVVFTAPFWLPALRGAPRDERWMKAGALATATLVLVASALVDHAFYAAPEWRPFKEMNDVRTLFTDYGLRQYFMGDPLHAMRLGFLPNDLIMVEGWFFADPRIFPAARLAELVGNVSLPTWWLSNVGRLPEFFSPFADESFFAPAALAAFAAWRARSRTAGWTLAALVVMMLALLILGRPGTTRIYTPVLAGVLFFALAGARAAPKRIDAIVAAGAVLALAIALGARNAADRAEEVEQRARMCSMPPERVYVVWAERLAYDKLFRPLSVPGDHCPLKIYPLAPLSYAPYAVERLREATGATDVVGALLAGNDLDLIADDWQVPLLERHLRYHYKRHLEWRVMRGDGLRGAWFRLHLLKPVS